MIRKMFNLVLALILLCLPVSLKAAVEDLNAVVDGAEAMINGDSMSAAIAWSNVQDDQLRWQLQREAEAMGLQLDSNN